MPLNDILILTDTVTDATIQEQALNDSYNYNVDKSNHEFQPKPLKQKYNKRQFIQEFLN